MSPQTRQLTAACDQYVCVLTFLCLPVVCHVPGLCSCVLSRVMTLLGLAVVHNVQEGSCALARAGKTPQREVDCPDEQEGNQANVSKPTPRKYV